jgi:hypothetical protein
MDCTTFQESEIDALYGELDAAGSAAMAEHATACASCGPRFDRLKGTRGLVLSVAVERVSDNFESRVMAAVDRGLAARMAPLVPITAGPHAVHGRPSALPSTPPMAPAPTPKQEGGATIFKFMSRPAFAAAATIVLVLGGAAIIMTQGSMKRAPMAASNDNGASAPLASAMSMPAAAPAANDPVAVGQASAAVAGEPLALVAPTATAATPQPVLAFNESAPVAAPTAAAEPPSLAAKRPQKPVVARSAPPPPAAAPARSTNATGAAGGDDRALAIAKGLVTAGRCTEALPKLEALKSSNPEAELYAARCVQQMRGCPAAGARYDSAAQANAGTPVGERANLEGARCYQAGGQIAEARKRYNRAKDEPSVSAEATRALDALDGKGGAPSGGVRAAPKAPAMEAAPTTDVMK